MSDIDLSSFSQEEQDQILQFVLNIAGKKPKIEENTQEGNTQEENIEEEHIQKKDIAVDDGANNNKAENKAENKAGNKAETKAQFIQSIKRSTHNAQQDKSTKKPESETKQATVQALDTTNKRPNLFMERGFGKMYKKDTKIDKLLHGDNEITPRCAARLVSVVCKQCGQQFMVSPALVFKTEDGLSFTCDKCTRTSQ